MDDKQLNNLIQKYINGACSSDELDILMDYIQGVQEDSQFREMLQRYWESSAIEITEKNLQQAYTKTEHTLAKIWEEEEPEPIKSRVFLSKSNWALVAALLLCFLSIGGWFWGQKATEVRVNKQETYLSNHPNTLTLPSGEFVSIAADNKGVRILMEDSYAKLVQIGSDEIQLIAKKEALQRNGWFALAVAKGKKMKVRLGDESIAWVNADSEFIFPVQFGKINRMVELRGEGYFEIKHAADRPFYVKGVEELVQVYGTKFTVRNYASEDKNKITLFEGKLSVRKKYLTSYQQEQMLAPGEQIEWHKSSDLLRKKTMAKDSKQVEWKADKKYYDNAPLKDIFLDLSHQYIIEIDWESIPTVRFQGYLPERANLDETLLLLSKIANIPIKRSNNVITF